MTFTRRIRIYLVAVALLPPLAVLSVVYLRSSQQAETAVPRQVSQKIMLAQRLQSSMEEDAAQSLRAIANSSQIRRAVLRLQKPSSQPQDLDLSLSALDFVEILNADNQVIASAHRPGLIGERLENAKAHTNADSSAVRATVEYDLNGRHAAFTGLINLEKGLHLYGGQYFDERLMSHWQAIVGGELSLFFAEDSADAVATYARMSLHEMYSVGEHYEAVVTGNHKAGYYLVVRFDHEARELLPESLLRITAVVALTSVLLAIVAGIYVTGRARREIDNLVGATARVAEGDFGTPVMAYEEGEFSQLADSISTMMVRLNESQKKLATTEKIAAWQLMGRKIAHEIKNPLTPISISADDLSRSYAEKLPDFEETLKKNCAMIRTEVNRLSRLLDEFVSFARMRPPLKSDTNISQMLAELSRLYLSQVDNKRLIIRNDSSCQRILLDPEQIKQLFINLIKNSLEAGENTRIWLTINDTTDSVVVTVEDNGSGFSVDQLKDGFQPYLSTKKDGSGLGLVICQRIVVDHGGSIELYNRSEGGAGVRVLLPIDNGQDSHS